MQRPTRRTGRIREGGFLAGIAAALIMLLLMRLEIVHFPGGLGFGLILAIIILSNCFWWSWVHRSLAARSAQGLPSARLWLLLSLVWSIYYLCMVLPFFLRWRGGRAWWDSLPVALLGWTLLLALAPGRAGKRGRAGRADHRAGSLGATWARAVSTWSGSPACHGPGRGRGACGFIRGCERGATRQRLGGCRAARC